ncbi:MAG: MoaD/ThiS family protein [Dehalococcoidia bacterium]|nr:MoaD/ThiS family protein [Dehalococcoidia bacterium]
MAVLHVPALLRPLCGGSDRLEVAARTLGELLRAADARCPGIYDRVAVDGALRPELAVAIDGEMQSFALHEPLGPGADVTIVPAIGGG